MWGFLGALAAGLLGYWAAKEQTKSNNSNIDKSLNAQSNENLKTRQYNLQLAKMQNEWNVEQWNRENAYNSPEQQLARLRAAGLNPDMMMGGGISNTSTSSPLMTSGAAAQSMDWSALANKRSIGDTAREALEIAQMRANVRKTEAEADIADTNSDILDTYGLETAELNKEHVREMVNKVASEAEGINYSNSIKRVESNFVDVFDDKIVKNYLQRLETSTGLSKNALKEDIETLTLRIAGINAENSKLVRMSDFTTEEWRLVFDVVKSLLGALK